MTVGRGATPRALPGGTAVTTILLVALVALVVVRLDRSILVGASDPALPLPWPDMRLDLNTASAAELTVLPGIGPRLAERIVGDRPARGPFRSIADLDRVHRIGPAHPALHRDRGRKGDRSVSPEGKIDRSPFRIGRH